MIWGVVLATQIQKDGRADHGFMEIAEDRITKGRQELVSAEEELVSKHN